VPFTPPTESGGNVNVQPGQEAVVMADLNLRDSAGTDGNILVVMPCGSVVQIIGGPSTDPAGWWNVGYTDDNGDPYAGWAAGNYLAATNAFDPNECGGTIDGGIVDMGGMPVLLSDLQQAIVGRAQLGVGYSYWWGHGAWAGDGSDIGSCSGNCPSCSHNGSYGADCSGYVAKAWQVPSQSALGVDEHPYSTQNFYDDQTLWTQIDRSDLDTADALVRWNGSDGHIVLFDTATDPMGQLWVFEAYGCATGIIHDLRTIDSTYRAIRLSQ
jgi:hypothetical protein